MVFGYEHRWLQDPGPVASALSWGLLGVFVSEAKSVGTGPRERASNSRGLATTPARRAIREDPGQTETWFLRQPVVEW